MANKVTDAQIAEAKAQHTEVHLLEANDEQILVRPATRAEMKKHVAMLTKEETRPLAFESLLGDTTVSPDRNGLAEILERQPGLALTFAKEIQKVSGLTNEVSAKKV